jgi:hypothetical protein
MRTVLGCVAIAISVAFAIASTPFGHRAASVERGVHKQYAAAFDYLCCSIQIPWCQRSNGLLMAGAARRRSERTGSRPRSSQLNLTSDQQSIRLRGSSIRADRNTRPRRLAVERNPESLTRTRQAGHDGSDRNLQDVSQLSIRQLLELAKHEQFTKTIWQDLHRALIKVTSSVWSNNAS